MIEKIISGGQTGADQAALDAAIKMGIPHGGWIITHVVIKVAYHFKTHFRKYRKRLSSTGSKILNALSIFPFHIIYVHHNTPLSKFKVFMHTHKP
jgi:hypothetical protein